MCKEEPFSCSFRCGVILNQDPIGKSHFDDCKKMHLDSTLALMMQAKKNKIFYYSII